MTAQLRGIFPAIVTPMHDDETIDEAGLRAHTRRMLDAGVHGIFSGGTNGEFYALSYAERLRTLEIVVDEVAGTAPVIAGTGCVTTGETIALTRAAGRAGAAAVSVITPYFAPATQEQLSDHFTAVADASEVPVMMYNIPARTQNSITPATVAKLAEHPRIVGAKDSSGDPSVLTGYIESTPEDFIVLAGSDALVLTGLAAGGDGAITGMANIFPGTMVAIHRAHQAGDLATAQAHQDAIAEFRKALQLGNPSTVVKEAVNLRGFPVGPGRAPFARLSDEARELLRAALSTSSELLH